MIYEYSIRVDDCIIYYYQTTTIVTSRGLSPLPTIKVEEVPLLPLELEFFCGDMLSDYYLC